MGCRRKEESEEREKSDIVGVFGANKIIGSSGMNPFTARSFYQSTMSPQRSSYGAYNLGSTRHGDAPHAARHSNSDMFVEYRNSRWQANLR